MVGNAGDAESVVAPGQLSHPTAGATDLFGDVVGNAAFGNQVKRPPAEFFMGLLALAVAFIRLVSSEMVFESDRAWHASFLHHLTLFRNSVLV